MDRVILHSDLNNFYASVECLYNPVLRNRPVAVCGSQSTRHGIVLAKNLIAKKMGVKTGEAVWEAKKKCPSLEVVRPNYSLYLKFSILARKIYEEYTNLVEAFGIDESWLDVTESARLFGTGEFIAEEIRRRMKDELGLTVSIGVSFNKIFAKLGSDIKKPDAVTTISHENFKEVVWKLPVEDLLYVGRSTGKKLRAVGICTIGDLARAPLGYLTNLLGKWGETIWIFANGYDDFPVNRVDFESLIKGIGNSLTTPRDLTCNQDIRLLAYVLSDSVAQRLRRHNFKGKTVQISVRDSSLTFIDRQAQLPFYTNISSEIACKACEIFQKNWDWTSAVRSFGIRVTDLVTADSYLQPTFFDDDTRLRKELLERSIDAIRARFGHYSVQRGLLLSDSSLNANPAEENIIHPVSYFKEGLA